MEQERAFLDAIKASPLDHGLRMMYSDWLDENDRAEEAVRQRQWIDAYHVIKDYTREWYNCDYDEDGQEIPGSRKFDYDAVMDEVAEWENMIRNRGKEIVYNWGRYTIALSFSTNHAQEVLGESAENRAEFWKAFTVLTGLEPPADLKEQEWYSCAC